MTQEIFVGFDCCKDFDNPQRTPRIYPRNITMNVGESKELFLRVVHPDCYESCYTWKILAGGGYLTPQEGIQTTYNAPSENEDCISSPTIEARCPRERLDKIHIAVNGLPEALSAYVKLREWTGLVFYDDPPLLPIDKNPYWEPGIWPLYYGMNIDLYTCDRTRLRRTWVGLVQRVSYVWGKPTLYDNTWVPVFARGQPRLYYGLYIQGDAKAAQQELLRVVVGQSLSGALASIPTEFLKLRPIYFKPFPTTFIPPQTIDVRMTWQVNKGCCIYDLIEED